MPDTADMLWSILSNAGYSVPSSGKSAGVSKSDFVLNTGKDFGEAPSLKSLIIQQISPNNRPSTGLETVEQWEIINPIVRSIKWGDLDYASDDLVEYTLEIVYDYAVFDSGKQTTGAAGLKEIVDKRKKEIEQRIEDKKIADSVGIFSEE